MTTVLLSSLSKITDYTSSVNIYTLDLGNGNSTVTASHTSSIARDLSSTSVLFKALFTHIIIIIIIIIITTRSRI